jgi:hypothetical protein
MLEPSLKDAQPEQRFQFERHGYFAADRVDSSPAPGLQPDRDAQGFLGQGRLTWPEAGAVRMRSTTAAPNQQPAVQPGMKGCELAGRFRFVDESKNERYWEKKAREKAAAEKAGP